MTTATIDRYQTPEGRSQFLQGILQPGWDPTNIALNLGSFGSALGIGGGGGNMGAKWDAMPSVLNPRSFGLNGAGMNISATMPTFTGTGPGGSGKTPWTDKAALALGGLQTIGGLYNAWQQNKLAKEQFNFTKEVTNTNLANQIQSYNTALSDRANTRAHMEGRSAESAAQYIEQNKARRNP